MYVGVVKWFDTKKGYGFITSNTVDYFVHFSEIVSNRDFKNLNDGDEVEFDQTLVEFETDKAVIAIPSPLAGKISEIRVAVGDEVAIGSVIMLVEAEGEDAVAGEEILEAEKPQQVEEPEEAPVPVSEPEPQPAPKAEPTKSAKPAARSHSSSYSHQFVNSSPPCSTCRSPTVGYRLLAGFIRLLLQL